jgi:hypothetical protein
MAVTCRLLSSASEMFTRISVSGGISSLYCGLTNPLALKKLFGSEARLNSTHGLEGAFDTASATVPTKTPVFGPRRIMTVSAGWPA